MHVVRIVRSVPALSYRVRIARRPSMAYRRRVPRRAPRAARASHARMRAWRRRGRRAQVSAIAVLFGLLILVSMIGNYLTSQLPRLMQSNDLDHGLQVEDQVGRLAALIASAVAEAPVGTPVTQPVSLGSNGEPPVAGPDGATISPGRTGSGMAVSFNVVGPLSYNPPGGWSAGGGAFAPGCFVSPAGSQNPSTVICGGGVTLNHNFTNGSHLISVTGGAVLNLNFQSNYSTIVVMTTGNSTNTLTLVGNYDTFFVNTTGGTKAYITIVGNYDSLILPTTGGSTIHVLLVGNNDPITQGSKGGTTVTVSAWGSEDSFNSTTTGGATIAVHYTGFNGSNASSPKCPYSNVSSSDTVSESSSGGGTFGVTYNNTVYSGTGSSGGWTETWSKVSGLGCPFFTPVALPYRNSGATLGSFVVHLHNLYAAEADVAFDSGAVVSAVAGGVPELVDPPLISNASGVLTITIPQFQGQFGAVRGTSTTVLAFRLASVQTIVLPANGFSLSSSVNVTVTTPYWAAWMNYFHTLPRSWGKVTCWPSPDCTGKFSFGSPMGNVTLLLSAPSLASLTVNVGTFAIMAV